MPQHDTDALYIALVEALGADCVSLDAAVAEAHAGDWSDAPRMRPRMTLLPRTPEDVAGALRVVGKHQQTVVVQGGLTGLAGGATPKAGEVALSLARVNAIESFDRIGGTVTVQAGVLLEQLQTFVEAEGWFFPLDLGARGTCQIGGNAATNAGGNRVIRFGTMRDLILGLEVALPDGTMLSMMNRVTKNTTGIDLKQLFIGSEGTLGVITRIVLKLEPKPSAANTALCAVASFDDATRLLKYLRGRLANLSSFELMWQDFMSAAMDIAHLKAPFGDAYPVYLLIETLGESDEDDRRTLEQTLERMLDDGIVQDVIIAQSIEHAKQLWAYRETIGELLSKLKPHAAFDIGIPMDRMDGFVETARMSLSARFPQQTHLFFGHLGDGNLHLLSGPYAHAGDLLKVEELIYAAVSEAQGCISAEHGIGVIKQPFLHYSRSSTELDLMQRLKTLLDPAGILNVGRVTK
ncbi:FAD-binding oxidoreductase [Paraburkholderia caribensis]|uniref:FAD-binding oxidoreductase n=1 Tax=Paraburkholderia caribensis TaxID=75105 RepID=UPI00071F0FD1|nr:FAD-binding oxidoreductase [Paraburkholderia caribensis]ALP68675.1 FAD-linked oxidase [Paraburkholderia caribensis]AUT58037.1 FAD-binding oxidoreductase [Paraburkholderia caribensis]